MIECIHIDSVFLNFGDVNILRGVNLTLNKNSVTGILGRNGSGKSCFLKVITGQISPQSKHIKFAGKQIINLFKTKGLINYLPQHEFHPKSLTVRELISFYGIDKEFLLDRYSIFTENIENKFKAISGGERRIIEVLLVLESNTKFSILDEPFTHLMPIHIDKVKRRITELKTKKGILITDHQYENILELSDDLFYMKGGILQKIKKKEELKTYGYIR